MTTNPLDPLLKTAANPALTLFGLFSKLAGGTGAVVDAHGHPFPLDAAIDAGINIIINALRQQHPTRAGAERAFDEYFGKAKQILVDHYDQLGRKRGIFPFDQTLMVDEQALDPDMFRKH